MSGKVHFRVIHPTHITIYSFEEQCLTKRFCKLSGKLHFNSKQEKLRASILRLNYCEINQVTSKCQKDFLKETCKKGLKQKK